ncbi:hypothetical protein BC2230_190013 [Burkholderia cepacia]
MTASVLVADTWPAATFVIWRSWPGAPTLTTPTGELPAKKYVMRPIVSLDMPTAVPVTEFAPSATEFATFAVALEPIAILASALAVVMKPAAKEDLPEALA